VRQLSVTPYGSPYTQTYQSVLIRRPSG
jgi:hypothetical protein